MQKPAFVCVFAKKPEPSADVGPDLVITGLHVAIAPPATAIVATAPPAGGNALRSPPTANRVFLPLPYEARGSFRRLANREKRQHLDRLRDRPEEYGAM